MRIYKTTKGYYYKEINRKKKLVKQRISESEYKKLKQSNKKLGAKKTPAKKTPTKKLGAKKTPTKKLGVKKLGAKKIGAKKIGAKKIGAKKIGAKKLGVKKLGAKKLSAKKLGAKKTPGKKLGAKKLSAKKLKGGGETDVLDELKKTFPILFDDITYTSIEKSRSVTRFPLLSKTDDELMTELPMTIVLVIDKLSNVNNTQKKGLIELKSIYNNVNGVVVNGVVLKESIEDKFEKVKRLLGIFPKNNLNLENNLNLNLKRNVNLEKNINLNLKRNVNLEKNLNLKRNVNLELTGEFFLPHVIEISRFTQDDKIGFIVGEDHITHNCPEGEDQYDYVELYEHIFNKFKESSEVLDFFIEDNQRHRDTSPIMPIDRLRILLEDCYHPVNLTAPPKKNINPTGTRCQWKPINANSGGIRVHWTDPSRDYDSNEIIGAEYDIGFGWCKDFNASNSPEMLKKDSAEKRKKVRIHIHNKYITSKESLKAIVKHDKAIQKRIERIERSNNNGISYDMEFFEIFMDRIINKWLSDSLSDILKLKPNKGHQEYENVYNALWHLSRFKQDIYTFLRIKKNYIKNIIIHVGHQHHNFLRDMMNEANKQNKQKYDVDVLTLSRDKCCAKIDLALIHFDRSVINNGLAINNVPVINNVQVNNGPVNLMDLLNTTQKIIFTSFNEFCEKNPSILIAKDPKRKMDVQQRFIFFIREYIDNGEHIFTSEYGNVIDFKLGNSIGDGSYGIIYEIENTNICIKFLLLEERKNNKNVVKDDKNMNHYLNVKGTTILPVKQLHMNESKTTYMNKSRYRVRTYLMLKCDGDIKQASRIKLMTEPEYIVRKPVILKQLLNDLMTQFSELQVNSDSLIPITTQTAQMNNSLIPNTIDRTLINPVQLFDLKTKNCALYTPPTINGLYIVENMRAYLIDLDGYYITRSNSNNDDYWISSFPPIEFYNERRLEKSNLVKPTDFANIISSHPNYYKLGLHSSWMLGILIYQMINLYCNLSVSEITTKPLNFFDFLNHKEHRLRNCTHDNNLFTSLDNFVESLDEPFKSEWMDVPDGSDKSFLDEIKSCLYFDDGYYDYYYLRNRPKERFDHHKINDTPCQKNKKIYPDLHWSPPFNNRVNNGRNNGRNNGKRRAPPIYRQSKLGQRRPFYNEDGSLNFF